MKRAESSAAAVVAPTIAPPVAVAPTIVLPAAVEPTTARAAVVAEPMMAPEVVVEARALRRRRRRTLRSLEDRRCTMGISCIRILRQ